MSTFSAEIPLEVVKQILIAHYQLEDVDNAYNICYNVESNTLVLEIQDALNDPNRVVH